MKFKVGQKVILYQLTANEYNESIYLHDNMYLYIGMEGCITGIYCDKFYEIQFEKQGWIIHEGDLKTSREQKFERILK